jgi:hypothetical protein
MGMGMIMGNPELAQYILNFGNPEFREIFFGTLGDCDPVPDWFYCAFGFEEYCDDEEPGRKHIRTGFKKAWEVCNSGIQNKIPLWLFGFLY